MKTNFARWRPTMTKAPTRRVALAAAGFAAVCGGIAGPLAAAGGGSQPAAATGGTAAPAMVEEAAQRSTPGADIALMADKSQAAPKGHAAPATSRGHAAPATPKDHKAPATPKGQKAAKPPAAPTADQLNYQYQQQVNFYYCGPAATRIALSAHGHSLSQDEVASRLGTTVNGTPSAEDTTRVLNSVNGNRAYHTTSIPGDFATPRQMDRLQSDVVRAIVKGNPVVANIKGTATDTLGGQHAYAGGHYVTVVGYVDDGRTVLIADPADTVGDGSYWVHTIDLANWMATRGYSS